MRQSSPVLIILEGPSGVGKTTLQRQLYEQLSQKRIKTGCLTEFSESPFGEVLTHYSKVDQTLPTFLTGLHGALAYLSDKLYLLEQALSSDQEILILDRFIISQWILGSHFSRDDKSKHLLQEMIFQAKIWIEDNFSNKSLIVVLESSQESLISRLEERIGQEVEEELKLFMEKNISDYQNFQYDMFAWNKIFLNTESSLNQTVEHLLQKVDQTIDFVNLP